MNVRGLQSFDSSVLVFDLPLVGRELNYLLLVNHLLDFGLESIDFLNTPLHFAVHDVP